MTTDAPPVARSRFEGLPYGPRFSASLPALHRAFLVANRTVAAPALRAGFGPFISTPFLGSLMLLRTRGRRSGLWREAPLGYVVLNGSVFCMAGFGSETHWYRNLLADPRVECVLPTVAVRGLAEPVTDRAEWEEAYRALIESLGLIGRLTTGDFRRLSEADLDRHRAAFPLVRIRPTSIAPGPFDPGGLGWIPATIAGLWLSIRVASLASGVVRWAGRMIRPRGATRRTPAAAGQD